MPTWKADYKLKHAPTPVHGKELLLGKSAAWGREIHADPHLTPFTDTQNLDEFKSQV